jgi:dihydrofolate reductase
MIAIVAAYSKNRVIGNDGRIPWKLHNEQKRFRDLTVGNIVIMGRKTFESVGRRLPDRMTIVLSRTCNFKGGCNLYTARSLQEAFEYAESHADLSDIFIAGGAGVYAEALPFCSKMYITEIDAYTAGNVLFPDFDTSLFTKTVDSKVFSDTLAYSYVTFTRKDDRR